jgi:hypothetical protein
LLQPGASARSAQYHGRFAIARAGVALIRMSHRAIHTDELTARVAAPRAQALASSTPNPVNPGR